MQNIKVEEVKEKFDNVVRNDPLGVAKFAKNKSASTKLRDQVYGLIIAIPILLLISFIFYMIASIDGTIFGTPEDEINNMISDKMKEIMQSAEDGGSSGQVKMGENFNTIQLGLKIIPNMDQHDFLLKRMSLVGGNETYYTGLEDNVDYDLDALGEESQYPYFFEWNGAQSLSFPTFIFDKDHVPLGDSMNLCLGISWTTIKKRNQYDKYLDVRGLDRCKQSLSGRFQWEKEYPVHGLNFNIWKQQAIKSDSVCSNGIYDEKNSVCYKYKRMTQVCLLIKFSKDTEKNTYSWVYTGGCYKDNSPIYYEEAMPQDVDDFKKVQFEVRQDTRDFSEIKQKIDDNISFNYEDYQSDVADDDLDYVNDPKNQTLSPADKIRLEKDALFKKAANGDVKPQGFYFFYKFFVFIGGLSLVLALVCVGCLIYFIVLILRPSGQELENQQLIRSNNSFQQNSMVQGPI